MRQNLQVELIQRDQQLVNLRVPLSDTCADLAPSELEVKGSTQFELCPPLPTRDFASSISTALVYPDDVMQRM